MRPPPRTMLAAGGVIALLLLTMSRRQPQSTPQVLSRGGSSSKRKPVAVEVDWNAAKKIFGAEAVNELLEERSVDTERLRNEAQSMAADKTYAQEVLEEVQSLHPKEGSPPGEYEAALQFLARQILDKESNEEGEHASVFSGDLSVMVAKALKFAYRSKDVALQKTIDAYRHNVAEQGPEGRAPHAPDLAEVFSHSSEFLDKDGAELFSKDDIDLVAFFDKHDSNKDGFLDKEEIKTISSIEGTALHVSAAQDLENDAQRTSDLLAEYDGDGDGKIGRDEFMKAATAVEAELKIHGLR